MRLTLPESYFSLKILKEPEEGRKGAMILSQVDCLLGEFPDIKQKFYIVERRGWRGLNESRYADVKLVEDLSLWDEALKLSPDAICLEIGPADFVDTSSFKPLDIAKDYCGIQVSHWSDFKRPELFTRAAGLLPGRRFLKMGHFVENGSAKELEIRDRNMSLAEEVGASIDLPYSDAMTNSSFPAAKEDMNRYINRAQVGILTTAIEGINRFKMECLSAGVPVLVPADTSYPTKKHINEETGDFFDPTPEGLARKIEEVIGNKHRYDPRSYIERTTGKRIALGKLRGALEELCRRDGQYLSFEGIDWDGRNQSMVWGKKVFEVLGRYNT